MTQTVFVSGATGYIAQQVVLALLNRAYKVVGSVRSAEKGDRLQKLIKHPNFSYEIVEAIDKEGSFDEALKRHPEVTVFLHTASPVFFTSNDVERDILLPAIQGTKNALKAIKEHGPQIKRVVVTSSFAAVHGFATSDPTVSVDETSWRDITYEDALTVPNAAYGGSKTFAERAAWDFVATEKPNFLLSTVNPVFVFGPQAFDESAKGVLNFSAGIIGNLLKLGPHDEVTQKPGFFIDVRDVAEAHLVAFESASAVNQRLILSGEYFSGQTLLDRLHKLYPELTDKLAKGNPGSDDNGIESITKVNTDKTKKILGFDYITLDKSLKDTVDQILKVNNYF